MNIICVTLIFITYLIVLFTELQVTRVCTICRGL